MASGDVDLPEQVLPARIPLLVIAFATRVLGEPAVNKIEHLIPRELNNSGRHVGVYFSADEDLAHANDPFSKM